MPECPLTCKAIKTLARPVSLLDRDGALRDRYPYPVQVWRFGTGLLWIIHPANLGNLSFLSFLWARQDHVPAVAHAGSKNELQRELKDPWIRGNGEFAETSGAHSGSCRRFIGIA